MRARHLVATVLVEPGVVADLELRVMTEDMWLWPVRTAPVVIDGARMEFQVRRRLVEQHRGEWDDAGTWTPVWIGFGAAWHEFGPDGNVVPTGPLPWAAHQRLWGALDEFTPFVRYRRRLGGIPTEPTAEWPGLHLH
ncbi:hypothetical protein SAMN04489844_3655 [Nocardioides exalbidus]|uniref:Uncharacterized protein n=1 Tax=Nocardioides exalbidus TaxID=402596 RepID=A0A1H4XU29_9ACTN|nr:hypothetical protein [Nocardioides exalbidus]SED09159.1 hypothetical protein SAMN04489844_3655 [Nocardioides exalbidus]